MDTLIDNLPMLLPLILLEVILMIFSLYHIFTHPHFKVGNKYIWIPIVVFIQFIGPILYFTIGRGEG